MLHAWYFMYFTMLQFASVWQVEYAYTTTCLVFHVCFMLHKWSMPTRQHAWYFMFTMLLLCLTSGVCLHDNMLGISCSRCFNSLLFNKWSMPTRQHAWYFMFTMLQFASVWQVEYAYTTTCLVFHVHDASIRDNMLVFHLTSGVCLHDNMLGISCSRCFNSLLFDKWSMPTRQHAWYFMFTMLQFASV